MNHLGSSGRWVPHAGYISPQATAESVVWYPPQQGSLNGIAQDGGRKDQALYQRHLATLHTDVSRSSAALSQFLHNDGWSGWEEDYDDLFGDDLEDLFGDDLENLFGGDPKKKHKKFRPFKLISKLFKRESKSGKSQAEKIVEAAQRAVASPQVIMMPSPPSPPPEKNTEKTVAIVVGSVAALAIVGLVGYKIASSK